jgi:ethanolamine utilization cobalamin adenosyltransferase
MDRRIGLRIGDVQAIKIPPKEEEDGEDGPKEPAGAGADASTAPGSGPAGSATEEPAALPPFTPPQRYECLGGGYLETKPEHMTALRGHLLVPKDHPLIALRGAIDSLEATILKAQVAFRRLGLDKGVAELGEVLAYVKAILRAEVLTEPLEEMPLFGLDAAELRRQSHHPREFFGIGHFFTTVDDGEAVVLLNELRTGARHVELVAYDAFKGADGRPCEREDIILALNRLSSAFYLMMFKAKLGKYANE